MQAHTHAPAPVLLVNNSSSGLQKQLGSKPITLRRDRGVGGRAGAGRHSQAGRQAGTRTHTHPNAWHSTTAAGPASSAPCWRGWGTRSSPSASVCTTTAVSGVLPFITRASLHVWGGGRGEGGALGAACGRMSRPLAGESEGRWRARAPRGASTCPGAGTAARGPWCLWGSSRRSAGQRVRVGGGGAAGVWGRALRRTCATTPALAARASPRTASCRMAV